MKQFRKNEGFTLVELMVTILVASIVTLSATTILLLGIRIMNKSTDTTEQQHTTRVLLTALEDLAAEGTITEVRNEIGQNPENAAEEVTLSWQVLNGTKVIFYFDRAEQTVYTGTKEQNAPLLTGVEESSVTREGKVLTFSVTTDTGTYDSSIYCRLMPDDHGGDNTATDLLVQLLSGNPIYTKVGLDNAGRNAFLKVLASQYGSRGAIVGGDGDGTYYSEWYIGGYGEANPTWNENTPWCACFISWALTHNDVNGHVNEPMEEPHKTKWYANVDAFLNDYFLMHSGGSSFEKYPYEPDTGDIIFFGTEEAGTPDPDHMGAVLDVEVYEDIRYVYTIEGNSHGRVTVRRYALNDPSILGYGILNWK